MRDIKRIDKVCDRLKQLWKQYPDLRLGQIILNVIQDPQLYYIEDDDLINILEKHYGGNNFDSNYQSEL